MFKEKYEKVIDLIKANCKTFNTYFKEMLSIINKLPNKVLEKLTFINACEYSPQIHHIRVYIKCFEYEDDSSKHGLKLTTINRTFAYQLYIDDINRYYTFEPFEKTIAKICKKDNFSSSSVEFIFNIKFNGKNAIIEVVKNEIINKTTTSKHLFSFKIDIFLLLKDVNNFSFDA